MAFKDRLPIDEQAAMQMAAAFGRGMSGIKETCGCVSGMAMVCCLTGNTMMFKGLGKGHSCSDLVGCAARLLEEVV